MSERIDDGGPAFPINIDRAATYVIDHCGMTLRDYFAGQAIGLFSLDRVELGKLASGADPNYAVVAKFVYGLADAMLKARAR